VHRIIFEQLAQNPCERPAIVTLQFANFFNIFCHKRLCFIFSTTNYAVDIGGRDAINRVSTANE
jgi:hypothetical protein